MLSKVITKGDWIFVVVGSAVIGTGYVLYTDGKHGFFFAWSGAVVGILIGLFLYAGVKRLVAGK